MSQFISPLQSYSPAPPAPGKFSRSGWRTFGIAMIALALAFGLAIYSGAAAQVGAVWAAGAAAIAALGLAGWVAITIVPALARRARIPWIAMRVDYRITREGIIFLVAVFVVALAALNTGNNLLFLILGCLLALIIASGIVSRTTISGIELQLELPEHVFAGVPAPAIIELRNLKQTLPSFALTVANFNASKKGSAPAGALLARPVYFPYLPRKSSVRNHVDLLFPRRGIYRQDALALRSRFPFGFLEKTRRLPAAAEIVVFPAIQPTDTFYEVLPLLSGELESYQRGRGHDLYAIRNFVESDNARFVDWKATAKSGALKVREFAREDERRVLIALDTSVATDEKFERAVSFCACLAWHFFELESVIGFRAPQTEIPLAPAADNIFDMLRRLAAIEPTVSKPTRDFLKELAAEPDVFKIVLTSRPRGSIPTSLWTSSYIVFFDSL
ncbi:MAG TPA: DUF58 domain-containing protein [Candidatus Acidoferrum sp.]|nr:DUF58 domain-containing protein [Candidatus Acidoferrum sp.]